MQHSLSEKDSLRRVSETVLWQQAQAGCCKSVNLLMSRHGGLVYAVVRQQGLGALPYDEALQAGRTGLWRAIMGYDCLRGTAFSTYAWTAIMRSVWAAVKKWKPKTTASLPATVPDRQQEPVRQWEKKELLAAIREASGHLPERLQLVVHMRYGWGGEDPATFRQIGERLGVSRQRACQLHQETLIRLRQPGLSYQLRELLEKHTVDEYQTVAAATALWRQKRGGRPWSCPS